MQHEINPRRKVPRTEKRKEVFQMAKKKKAAKKVAKKKTTKRKTTTKRKATKKRR
jgi:hypothetical protein